MTTTEARGPLAVSRREALLRALRESGTVRVSDLSEYLGVAPVTIRRDIAQLAEEGLLRRVHGGATLLPSGAGEPEVEELSPASATRAPSVASQSELGIHGSVGMLVPSLDYYWPGVVRGAEEAAATAGLNLQLRSSSYEIDQDRPQLRRLVETLGVDGLVAAPRMDVPSAPETLEWLTDLGIPVVLVERMAAAGPHHQVMESVVTDFALGTGIAVRHLVELGHKKIGLLASYRSPNRPHIERGWVDVTTELGMDPATLVMRTIDNDRNAERMPVIDDVLDECLATGTTAMIVHADPEAIAFVQRCEQRHLSVPGDMSVVAYDDDVAGLFSPRLSAVRTPRRSLGRAAVELVAARLADPGRPAHRVIVSPTLRVRETSGPPRNPAEG